MTDKLALNLLGQADVRLAGKPLTGFYSGKAQALLFYLAVTRQTHTRPALANLPDSDALTNLRKLVGPYLTITRQTVTFNPNSHYRLDVADFLAGIDRTDWPSPQPSGEETASRPGGRGSLSPPFGDRRKD